MNTIVCVYLMCTLIHCLFPVKRYQFKSYGVVSISRYDQEEAVQNDINTSAIANVKQTYILKCFAAIFMYIYMIMDIHIHINVYIRICVYVLVNVLYKLI